MKRVLTATVIVLLPATLALAGSVVLSENTSLIGGSGGTSYTIKCNDGDVLVGLGSSVGQWVDLVSARCAKPNMSTGSWSGVYEGATYAGKHNFGAYYSQDFCPNGYAIKAFRGEAGMYVNEVRADCYKLTSGARTTDEMSTEKVTAVGRDDATKYGPHKCSEAKPAVGIRGRHGSYIDAFGLICDYIMPGSLVLLTPASGAQVTTKRPTFDWDPVTRVTQPYQICLNLSSGAACHISGTVKATINLPASQWVPASDLSFARGDVVYWRVDACNENGCTTKTSSFRYMP